MAPQVISKSAYANGGLFSLELLATTTKRGGLFQFQSFKLNSLTELDGVDSLPLRDLIKPALEISRKRATTM